MTSHWQTVYQSKQPSSVSWFAPHLDGSLVLLKQAGLNADSRVIDVGAGASTLVDDLLDLGIRQITALDIAESALDVSRARLGERAKHVAWLATDVLKARLAPDSFELWHDRATLHFLTDLADSAAYVSIASQAIVSGGHAVIGGFAAEGPTQCSQLPVMRRDPSDIAQLFGDRFELVKAHCEMHQTPWGTPQSFAFALLRKTD